jgi:hypothetical protein
MKKWVHKTVATRLSEPSELLLKTALWKGPAARQAGLRWLESAKIETVSTGTRRLLPLAYDSLLREGVEHAFMPLMKGIKRHTWFVNRLLFRGADPVVTALRQAGVEVMILKGAPLAIAYYRDFALRSMSDIDLLVRFESARAAVHLLVEMGWTPELSLTGLDRHLRYDNARHFSKQEKEKIDLHWHLLPFCVGPHADDSFWEGSREMQFESNTVRALNPADQLLHTCVHGAEWGRAATVQWIADAMVILRETPDLDWDRLLKQARLRELTLCMREALRYMNSTFEAPVPRQVLRDLDSARVTPREERRYLDVINHQPEQLATLAEAVRRYERIARCFGHHEGSSFLDYVRSCARVEQTWQLPLVVLEKVWQKGFGELKERRQPLQAPPV